MAKWTLEAETRRKEYEALMERRKNRTPENSFYQKPLIYRDYNVERCAYARPRVSTSSENE